jgi:hypothetical protein
MGYGLVLVCLHALLPLPLQTVRLQLVRMFVVSFVYQIFLDTTDFRLNHLLQRIVQHKSVTLVKFEDCVPAKGADPVNKYTGLFQLRCFKFRAELSFIGPFSFQNFMNASHVSWSAA